MTDMSLSRFSLVELLVDIRQVSTHVRSKTCTAHTFQDVRMMKGKVINTLWLQPAPFQSYWRGIIVNIRAVIVHYV